MSEVNDPIIQLIEEYLSGEMEDVRREELTAWLDKKEENRLFFERLIQDGTWEQRWRQWEKIDTEAAIRRFDRCTRLDHGKRAYKRWVAAVAVAALLLLAVGFSLRQLMNRTEVAPVLVENILPGSYIDFGKWRKDEAGEQRFFASRFGSRKPIGEQR